MSNNDIEVELEKNKIEHDIRIIHSMCNIDVDLSSNNTLSLAVATKITVSTTSGYGPHQNKTWTTYTLTINDGGYPSWVKVDGNWCGAVPWVKVNGTWYSGITWVKVDGNWVKNTNI